MPSDPYFLPYDPIAGTGNPCFPLGQHWISTTKVDRAWWRVGYRLNTPIVLDPDDRSRVIAIIDTGIEQTHPEFGADVNGTPKIHTDSRSIFDARSGQSGPFCPCDPPALSPEQVLSFQDVLCVFGGSLVNSHGTIEAGLAGADGNNGLGIAGVAWDASVLTIRVVAIMEHACDGATHMACASDESNVAAAITYAASRARVLCIASTNIYGNWCYDDTDEEWSEEVREAIRNAYNAGCVIIAIAGNDQSGQNGPIDNGLGLHPYTITVGGCDLEGQWAHPFSRRNPLPSEYTDFNSCLEQSEYGDIQYTPDGRIKALSVVAPIEEIFSTWAYACDIECDAGDPNDPLDDTPGFRMTTAPGTSWAAGQVAGIAALLLKVRPDLTPAQVKQVLEVTATDLVDDEGAYEGYDRFTGYGLVNAHAALVYALKLAYPGDWNGDGNVETLDAVQYTIDYTNSDVMTDLNLDTAQTADDMAIFLNSYTGE